METPSHAKIHTYTHTYSHDSDSELVSPFRDGDPITRKAADLMELSISEGYFVSLMDVDLRNEDVRQLAGIVFYMYMCVYLCVLRL